MTLDPSSSHDGVPRSVAIVPSTDVFEDHFGRGLGLTRRDYVEGYNNDWVFRYVDLMVELGLRVSIVMPSLEISSVESRRHGIAPCDVVFTPVGPVVRSWPQALKRTEVVRRRYSKATASKSMLAELSKFDVVYAQEYTYGRFERLVARLSGTTPVIGAHHGASLTTHGASGLNKLSPRLTTLTTLTEVECRHLESLLEDRWHAHVRVVPNWVDERHFHYEHVGTRAGLVWSGRFNMEHKGLDLLLDALAGLDPASWAPLTLVGMGPDETTLRDLARRLGIQEHVHWRGFIADRAELRHEYSRHRVFISPSRYEGLPLTVLEAQACGLPVVASDIPGHREAVDPTKSRLFDVGSSAALRSALSRSLTELGDLEEDDRASLSAWTLERFGREAAGRRLGSLLLGK